MDIIKFKRGLFKNLPKTLEIGEPAYCIDTGELYVGNDDGIPELVVMADMEFDGGRFDEVIEEDDVVILEGGYF